MPSNEVPEWVLRVACYLCGAKVGGSAELTMPSWLRALEGGELVHIGSNSFLGGLGQKHGHVVAAALIQLFHVVFPYLDDSP